MLKEVITDFIDTVKEPLKKELNFIKNNDWSTAKDIKKRELEHSLHATIADRAVKSAKDLHKIAIKDLSHPEVKGVMKIVKEMFDIYEQRYYDYTEREDWTKYLEVGKDVTDIEVEMKFQSDIRNQLNALKRTMRDINFGEDSDKVEIRIFNDTPVPILLKEVFEEAFPDVKRKETEDEKEESKTPAKATRSPRKNTKVSKRSKRS